MNIPDYRIEPADYRADLADLRTVREQVFVGEQNIPSEIEFDEIDPHCQHAIARDALHRPIGTGRLTPEHKIGRMAVLPEWRNRGVGKALLQALIDKAASLGWTEVDTFAQVSVTGFYEKFGFIRMGDVFTEAGIPHQAMHLKLHTPLTSAHPALSLRRLTVKAVELITLDDAIKATAEVIAQASRLLCIYTRDLETDIYGRKEIVDAFKQFALRHRDGATQIIVQNPIAARTQPHPLVALAQRLPSSFSFRTPVEPEDIQYPSAFIVNDRDGYLFQPFGNRYQGHWSPVLPKQKKQLFEAFDSMWQRSLPCTEFRALSI